MYSMSRTCAIVAKLLVAYYSTVVSASLSYCPLAPTCTIFEDSYYINFPTAEYVYTTFSDLDAYSSFHSSLSESTTTGEPFHITLVPTASAITPPASTVETAPGKFTTVPCCDNKQVFGYFLLDPASKSGDDKDGCGPTSTMHFNYVDYSFNDFTATVLPTASPTPGTEIVGRNKCKTVTPAALFAPSPPVLTKTFVAELIVRATPSAKSTGKPRNRNTTASMATEPISPTVEVTSSITKTTIEALVANVTKSSGTITKPRSWNLIIALSSIFASFCWTL